MDEVIIEKQEYLLFDKYKLNTNRNITRYEYISNVPLKVSKREPDMRVCKCGAHLITLAYIFDNNIFRSRTLLGRKCPCCGHNYFTLKTIALCEEAFTIVEYNNCRYAEVGQIAFIKEHGKCIVENEALQTLMQL